MHTDDLLNHFSEPRNAGRIADADGVGSACNPLCGDQVRIYLKVDEGVIRRASFQAFGCRAAIAAASAVTECARGRKLEDASRAVRDMLTVLGGAVSRERARCVEIVEEAFHAAVAGLPEQGSGDRVSRNDLCLNGS